MNQLQLLRSINLVFPVNVYVVILFFRSYYDMQVTHGQKMRIAGLPK